MHLTAGEFVDVVEGARSEASLAHLAECHACRDRLAAIRATFRAAAEADVPEPPAFFWPRFSAQVRERLDAEERRGWWRGWTRPRLLAPLSALAILAVVGALLVRPRLSPSSVQEIPAPVSADLSSDSSTDPGVDPSLALVADLTASLDWDAAADAGFAEPGGADHAVAHMNTNELRALERLLKQELGGTGA